VFPWVLRDYVSDDISLEDPEVYRDLSMPMGALDETRRRNIEESYPIPKEMEGVKVNGQERPPPLYHYTSLYSSSAIVSFFLMRLEPFTTRHLELQSGRFDHADRLMDSVAGCWNSALKQSCDFKELIPEMYYLPEMFVNINGFDFGSKQTGKAVRDIELPPWAHNDPNEFVRIHREALESDYVSANLNQWIDLIFGYKQRGPEAVKALNAFHWLSYDDVDVDAIDTRDRAAAEDHINHIGQAPSQLFTRKHPVRQPVAPHIDSPTTNVWQQQKLAGLVFAVYSKPISHIRCLTDRVHTLSAERVLGVHRWNAFPTFQGYPVALHVDPAPYSRRIAVEQLSAAPPQEAHRFGSSPDGKLIYSCGFWDNSIRVTAVDGQRPIQTVYGHVDSVTCLAVSDDGCFLITGSADTTAMVWRLNPQWEAKGRTAIDDPPLHHLHGHTKEVVCVALNSANHIAASGSTDGTVILHDLSRGRYLRTIRPPRDSSLGRPLTKCAVELLAVSSLGHIVLYCDGHLHVCTLNGHFLASDYGHERPLTLLVTRDGTTLLSGGRAQQVVVRSMHNLARLHTIPSEVPAAGPVIHCLALSYPDEENIFVGLESGQLVIHPLDRTELEERRRTTIDTGSVSGKPTS